VIGHIAPETSGTRASGSSKETLGIRKAMML